MVKVFGLINAALELYPLKLPQEQHLGWNLLRTRQENGEYPNILLDAPCHEGADLDGLPATEACSTDEDQRRPAPRKVLLDNILEEATRRDLLLVNPRLQASFPQICGNFLN